MTTPRLAYVGYNTQVALHTKQQDRWHALRVKPTNTLFLAVILSMQFASSPSPSVH